jgi:hypothetical protein
MRAGSSLKADVVRLRFDGFELDEADARLTRAGHRARNQLVWQYAGGW